ncbi:MAG TPA: 3-deoxy-D-manno-octulosonic acid transferase [Acidobacteriota bacterium]|nr:3-deoxy-D-manno-octulosonic acid transferase [Acidobacteriota bacterium]
MSRDGDRPLIFFWYNLALVVGLPLVLPYYVFRAIRHGKYLPGFKERLGYLPSALRFSRGPVKSVIWIHAVSVGEALAARPLAMALRTCYPQARIVISTTTETGQQRAREQLAMLDGHFYFPLDVPGVVTRALDHIQPSLVIILETEIWPNFLRACARRSIPVVLVNGRLSDRSFGRYHRVRRWLQPVLALFTRMLMQSNGDAERILALGADPDRVRMIGNLKYEPPDAGEVTRRDRVARELDAQFGLSSSPGPLLVAGSTVEGEEPMLVKAFEQLRSCPGLEFLRLLIVPRHPERFEAVNQILSQAGGPIARRSKPSTTDSTASVMMLDSIGELAAVYRFATVVFVGGSLVPRGGHNILEPAADGRAVVTGPFTENFRDIMATFVAAQAVKQLPPDTPDGLIQRFVAVCEELLVNAESRQSIGARARMTYEAQSGATARAIEEIKALLEPEK